MKHQKIWTWRCFINTLQEEEEKNSQKEKTPEREEEDMDSEDSDDNQSIMCATMSQRANYVCFKPLMYYNKAPRQILLLQVL